MLPQQDDLTCGPTCLEAIYRYYGNRIKLDEIIDNVVSLPDGGTLAVWLACDALKRGFDAQILTYNLHLFDPTWFEDNNSISDRLTEQLRYKHDKKLQLATQGYLEFLRLGGSLEFKELNAALIRKFLKNGHPILTGLSATYLYGCAREHKDDYDSVRGHPTGHFVVLSGYDKDKRTVSVADPLLDNPKFSGHYYDVVIARLIGAILLGVLTHDANLLIVRPKTKR